MHTHTLTQMGKVQKKLGRLHEALASFNQALDLDPKSGNMIKAHIDRLQVCATSDTRRKRCAYAWSVTDALTWYHTHTHK